MRVESFLGRHRDLGIGVLVQPITQLLILEDRLPDAENLPGESGHHYRCKGTQNNRAAGHQRQQPVVRF